MKALAAGILLALFALGLALPAIGAPPPSADPSLRDWYESLKQPDTGVGCCSLSDCRRLGVGEWKATEAGFEILIRGEWVKVPWAKVLTNKDNPTGSPVACFNAEMKVVYCFVRGFES